MLRIGDESEIAYLSREQKIHILMNKFLIGWVLAELFFLSNLYFSTMTFYGRNRDFLKSQQFL